MSKGKRRERQAASLYERAGYLVETPNRTGSQWNTGGLDYFGLFDLMAIRAEADRLVMSQVKSNRTRGIADWFADCEDLLSTVNVDVHYLVAHDNEGWRLAVDHPMDGYNWAVDERDEDGAMGDMIVEYLGGSVDDE